jgi:hypothetical protein
MAAPLVRESDTPGNNHKIYLYHFHFCILMMTSLEERTMQQKLDAVKWDMLNEWAQTRKAPQHAAWMHEKPTGQP